MWSEFRLVGLNRLRRRTYDPVIIKRTIGIVLGPFTALYRSFLMHCTLTNKTVGTIWRDLSKPPQRRQGPDPRPLWLLVGNPLFLGPELASRRAEHRLLWRMSLYIFDLLFYHLTCLWNDFCGMSAFVGCWSLAFIRRIIYKFLNACPFHYTAFVVSGKVGIPLTGLTSPVGWLSLSQLTVQSRCAIVVLWFLVAFVCCHVALCFFFYRCKGFYYTRTESDLFLFLLDFCMKVY